MFTGVIDSTELRPRCGSSSQNPGCSSRGRRSSNASEMEMRLREEMRQQQEMMRKQHEEFIRQQQEYMTSYHMRTQEALSVCITTIMVHSLI